MEDEIRYHGERFFRLFLFIYLGYGTKEEESLIGIAFALAVLTMSAHPHDFGRRHIPRGN